MNDNHCEARDVRQFWMLATGEPLRDPFQFVWFILYVKQKTEKTIFPGLFFKICRSRLSNRYLLLGDGEDYDQVMRTSDTYER